MTVSKMHFISANSLTISIQWKPINDCNHLHQKNINFASWSIPFDWISTYFCKGKYPSSLTTFAYLPSMIRCFIDTVSIVIIIILEMFLRHTHNREWLLFYLVRSSLPCKIRSFNRMSRIVIQWKTTDLVSLFALFIHQ